jgi:PhzF family phenazine biosynthesis protein
MGLKLYQVDAFTGDLFSGNPAGVCVVDENIFGNDAFLQNTAAEMNLSETAFLLRRDETSFDLRWFTPTMEVPICGHATLSSAHILFETGVVSDREQISFSTLSGILRAKRSGSLIELDFPAVTVTPSRDSRAAFSALGISPVFFGAEGEWALCEVETEEELRGISPDFSALRNCTPSDWIITCASPDPDYDFYSRMFAPAVGIDEDPVTGAAHCVLAPYWGRKTGKRVLRARQVSKRGGELECETAGDRVLLRGSARTVLDINMRISL